jgi:hypothetical protein
MPNVAKSNPPMTETIDSANAAASTLFLGQNGEFWDFWLILSVVIAAGAAIAIGVTTAGSIVSHKREAASSEEALAKYKLDTAKDIADANARVAEAQLELFKLRSPRQLNDTVFKKELADRPRWPIVDLLFTDASDCRFFAMDIVITLAGIGWSAPIPQPLLGANQASEFLRYQSPIESWGASTTGVSVVAKEIREGSPQEFLVKALAAALPGWQVSGSRDSSMAPDTLRIVVAPRL